MALKSVMGRMQFRLDGDATRVPRIEIENVNALTAMQNSATERKVDSSKLKKILLLMFWNVQFKTKIFMIGQISTLELSDLFENTMGIRGFCKISLGAKKFLPRSLFLAFRL